MAKDIMNLSSEEDLKEYLEDVHAHVSEELQTARDNLEEIKETHDESIFSINSVEDLEGLDQYAIFYYIQAIQTLATSIDTNAFHKLGNVISRIDTALSDVPTMWDAMKITSDWKKLNKHLEENPSVKEEWDILLMAIRLTEDE